TLLVSAAPVGQYTPSVRDPQTGFGNWSPPQGQTMPGALITAVPWGNRFVFFVADPGGGFITAVGDPQTGFANWSPPQFQTMPGAPTTAIFWLNPLALFVAR